MFDQSSSSLILFLVATIVGCAVAGLGYFFARRAGLSQVQAEYVATLRDLNSSLDVKLELMQERLDREQKQVSDLTLRVQRLERTIVELTTENHDLRSENAELRKAKS